MAPLFAKKDSVLDKKLKSIRNQSSLIEDHIKQLEKSMRRKSAGYVDNPVMPEKDWTSDVFRESKEPVVSSSAKSQTARSAKLGKDLVTGSFQPTACREVPDGVRRNRRIFFIIIGVLLLIIVVWLFLW